MKNYLRPNSNLRPPNKKVVKAIQNIVEWYFKPTYSGLDNLDKHQPALYVSNHTLLGITDGPLYMSKLWNEKRIFLRPLVDKMQRHIPIWRKLITDIGGVIASRENCRNLMNQHQHILVFPGGTNEAFKKQGEEYQLIWKERYGFVKLAIENKYPIIPIAGLGGDELYDILLDKDDIMRSFIGQWLKDTGIADKYLKGGENIPPLVSGWGGTLLPRRKHIYYHFGTPIQTAQYGGIASEDVIKLIRKQVEVSLYKGMQEMQVLREERRKKYKKKKKR